MALVPLEEVPLLAEEVPLLAEEEVQLPEEGAEHHPFLEEEEEVHHPFPAEVEVVVVVHHPFPEEEEEGLVWQRALWASLFSCVYRLCASGEVVLLQEDALPWVVAEEEVDLAFWVLATATFALLSTSLA